MKTFLMSLVVLVVMGTGVGMFDGTASARATRPAADLPPGTAVLPADPIAGGRFQRQGRSEGTHEIIDVDEVVDGVRLDKAVRVDVTSDFPGRFDLEWIVPSVGPTRSGDMVLVTLFIRSERSGDETGEGRVLVYFQNSQNKQKNGWPMNVSAGPQWQRVDLPVRVNQTLGAGQSELGIAFSVGRPQTIEVAGMAVTNYGPSVNPGDLPHPNLTYDGREPDASWRAEAADRIEKHRQSDLRVRVTDADGRPVQGASVDVEMTRHAFKFGTAVRGLHLAGGGDDGAAIRDRLAHHFNHLVLANDLKWTEWVDPQKRRLTMRALHWARENGFTMHGHVLVWAGWRFMPEEVRTLRHDPEALRQAVYANIREILTETAGLVDTWDVLNEPYNNRDLMEVLGDSEMAEWFKLARELSPDTPLQLNEIYIPGRNEIGNRLARDLETIRSNGGQVDSIGFQSHFGWRPMPIGEVWSALQRFSPMSDPDAPVIEVTEYDVVAPDEAMIADYTRDFMTIMYSHPNVVGITMWGFWDGAHWKGDAPLFRRDWTLKPSGEVYQRLVFGDWWTQEQATTDADGTASVRGHFGEHRVTVTHDGRTSTETVTLGRDGAEVTVRMAQDAR